MAIGCGGNFAKIILIIYNILLLVTGCFLIGLGIWLIADGSIKNVIDLTFSGRNSTLFRDAAIILIAIGCLILFVSIFGIIAAVKESIILLTIYIVLLGVIFCGEITGAVVAIAFRDKIQKNLDTYLSDSLSKQLNSSYPSHYYNEDSNNTRCYTSDIGYLWDFVQVKFSCCGTRTKNNGYGQTDFKSMCSKLKTTNIPLSCCPFATNLNRTIEWSDFHKKPDNQYESQNLVDCSNYYKQGCYESIGDWVEKYTPVLIGIGLGFAMLQMFGIIFAVCLCRNADDD